MTALTRQHLDQVTRDAGLPAMMWAPIPPGCIARAVGWRWTKPLSNDVAEVQEIGRNLCASTGLSYVAAVLPRDGGVALAVGPVRS